MSQDQDDIITIPEFYKGKCVFITGGSGFIGKVLIEKLLRSCPDIGDVYLLMRPKKGKNQQERLDTMTALPLFDCLRKEHAENLSKLKIVSGDMTKLDLGLSPEDRDILIEKINVIFHGAASVRFDDPLKKAIIMNTRGTREIISLALAMKNLKVMTYISTTYCQVDKKRIEEKLYPACVDWRRAIKLAENLDPHMSDIFTKKYIGHFPNTYTFTKSMNEQMIDDLCAGKIPSFILRPSIVISTMEEPMPGWIDNFNGPIGILVACGKGVCRTMYTNPDIAADYIPVDYVVKGLIVGVWKKYIEGTYDVSVYNMSNNHLETISFTHLIEVGKTICFDNPYQGILWFPAGAPTRYYFVYALKFIFNQLIPALLVDGVMLLTGHKPILLKVQRTIYAANLALEYFVTNEWDFVNEKILKLLDEIPPSDQESFGANYKNVNVMEYLRNALIGTQTYLMKEKNKNVEKDKFVLNIFWVLYIIWNILWYGAMFWLIFIKFDSLTILCRKCNEALEYFTTD